MRRWRSAGQTWTFKGEKLTIERQAGGADGADETTKNRKGRTVDFTPALKKHLLRNEDPPRP